MINEMQEERRIGGSRSLDIGYRAHRLKRNEFWRRKQQQEAERTALEAAL